MQMIPGFSEQHHHHKHMPLNLFISFDCASDCWGAHFELGHGRSKKTIQKAKPN